MTALGLLSLPFAVSAALAAARLAPEDRPFALLPFALLLVGASLLYVARTA